MNLRVEVKPHWINGWFLRLFSRPVLVVDSVEYPLTWSSPTKVEIDESHGARIGVGVRYFGRGKLLGVHMTDLPRAIQLPADSALQNEPVALTFRNGMWNHEPFVLAG